MMTLFTISSVDWIEMDEGGCDFWNHFVVKQLAFSVMGLIVGSIFYHIGYERLIKFSPIGFFLILLLLLGVLTPLGTQIKGSKRWIYIGKISLQPSEFMKIMLPLFYIDLFFRKDFLSCGKVFCLWQLLFLSPIFLILMEPDNGGAILLFIAMLMLYFLTKIHWQYWFLPFLLFSVAVVFIGSRMQYVSDRLFVYLHPEEDLNGRGHQPYQAKIAIGSGGVLGKGLGKSLQKFHYLPESKSDYIAAIYAEETGFLGITFLISLYMILGVVGFRIALLAPDDRGYYMASLFTFMLIFQSFLNLGVISNLLPSKGSSLPFFSQGGSSLLTSLIMIFLIANTERQKSIHKISIT